MRRLLAGLTAAAVLIAAATALSAGGVKPPSRVRAKAGVERVTLTWKASPSKHVAGYRVYRRRASSSRWPKKPLASTKSAARRYVDRGLTGGIAYAYRVRAFTKTRKSRFSKTVKATATAAPVTPPVVTPPVVPPVVPPPAGPCGSTSTPPAAYDHVVWIVMENKSYDAIIGSANAPYTNKLADQCAKATNFVAETHPSLPNYIAMTSGSPQGIADDASPVVHPLDVPSIFSQLGTGWRSPQESMPSNCFLGNSGQYAVKHNPAAYYTNIRSDCNKFDVPLGDTPDISARFTFVTPNLCNDTHDCSVATGDTWLQTFLGKVFASSEYQAGRTAVFLTWDEDDGSASNHIATVVAAPSIAPGTAPAARFDHYSMLRTTEEMLGLGFIGNAATATSMRSAFNL